MTDVIAITAFALLAVAGLLAHFLRRRGLHSCALPYVLQSRRRRVPAADQTVHLFLCIADHFEPQWHQPQPHVARQRVQNWALRYPQLFDGFRDSDGRTPRHTFFFPIDQYEAEHVDGLTDLCGRGHGEVEIHLHHDHDTADNLRKTLLNYAAIFSERHGLLARRRNSNEIAYGFIHGNWALDNARPDGRWCGVNNELDVLRETGCYADFTLPSAPSPTQTRKINSIYYAKDDPRRPKSHDRGVDVGTAAPPRDSLMLIQGPLLLDWRRRKVENACLQHSQPPSMRRLDLWLRANIHVRSRPDWRFVKLHTHGAARSQPGSFARRGDGRISPRPCAAGAGESAFPFSLRDGKRDVQPGARGRRWIRRRGRRRARLRACRQFRHVTSGFSRLRNHHGSGNVGKMSRLQRKRRPGLLSTHL